MAFRASGRGGARYNMGPGAWASSFALCDDDVRAVVRVGGARAVVRVGGARLMAGRGWW